MENINISSEKKIEERADYLLPVKRTSTRVLTKEEAVLDLRWAGVGGFICGDIPEVSGPLIHVLISPRNRHSGALIGCWTISPHGPRPYLRFSSSEPARHMLPNILPSATLEPCGRGASRESSLVFWKLTHPYNAKILGYVFFSM